MKSRRKTRNYKKSVSKTNLRQRSANGSEKISTIAVHYEMVSNKIYDTKFKDLIPKI